MRWPCAASVVRSEAPRAHIWKRSQPSGGLGVTCPPRIRSRCTSGELTKVRLVQRSLPAVPAKDRCTPSHRGRTVRVHAQKARSSEPGRTENPKWQASYKAPRTVVERKSPTSCAGLAAGAELARASQEHHNGRPKSSWRARLGTSPWACATRKRLGAQLSGQARQGAAEPVPWDGEGGLDARGGTQRDNGGSLAHQSCQSWAPALTKPHRGALSKPLPRLATVICRAGN